MPAEESVPFDVHGLIDGIVDADSFFEIKPLFAAEVVVGFARLDGRPVGVVANNSAVKGGVLFVDSADKCARFIWLCDAFNVPLLYLADVPGFMIGSDVERQGIIRHGAKMITAVSEATVPQVSVIVRKAYGAGLYAMAGPGFEPDACIALPTAQDRDHGPAGGDQRGVREQDRRDRGRGRARRSSSPTKRAEYEEDVDILRLAADLVIDAIIEPGELRAELIRRFAVLVGKDRALQRQAARGAAGMSTRGRADARGAAPADAGRARRATRVPPHVGAVRAVAPTSGCGAARRHARRCIRATVTRVDEYCYVR